MIIRIFFAAILAGIIAGVFYTGAQAVKVVPIIIEAEAYESGGETLENHSHATVEEGQTAHEHNPDAWAPQDGFERTFYSLISNVLVGVAYSLLLVAAIVLSKMPVSPKIGIAWGAAGFVVFVFGVLVSESFIIGAIVGVMAFAGVTLASSTDNCCAQYLIMDCCCDCICSMLNSSGGSRRR